MAAPISQPVAAPGRPATRGRGRPWVWAKAGPLLLSLVLLSLAVLWLLPLAWAVLTALKPEPEIIQLPIRWLPSRFTLEHFATALTTSRTANVGRAFLNSAYVATVETFLILVIDAMAGYALARIAFPGRNLVFALVVGSTMIPGQVTLVPTYLLFQKLGLLSTYTALILPGLSRAFGVFLLRQFFLTLPRDLEDAARIDGAGPLGIFRHVALPLVRPALASLAIFTFLWNWNSFIWPLIAVSKNDVMTLPVALARLFSSYRVEYGVVMAGAALSALPLIIVFFLAQQHIVASIARTGMKD